MRRTYRPLLAALLPLSALLAGPAGARAQFRYGVNPAAGYGYAQTQAVANAATYRPGFSYRPYFGGYGNTYNVQDPVSGYLSGAADVMSASGQYEIAHQQANLGREQVKSAQMDNRRKMFDQLRYEQANTPTQWQLQEESRREQLQQARLNPTDGEIWSGRDLNLLLQDIRIHEQTMGLRGAEIPLDPEVVKHISLGAGTSSASTPTASTALLNNGGKLKWPPELDDERFDEQRKKIDQLFLAATQQATGPDGLSGRTMRQLADSLDQLQDQIDGAIKDMTPSDNIRATRFVKEVTASTKLLRDPNVTKTLSGGEWAPKGATVGELIANMNRNGQKFGPAGPADRPYYSSLYMSLLEYQSSLMAMGARAGPSPGLQQ
jgi:hypothetical protein